MDSAPVPGRSPLVTLHLWTVPAGAVPAALARMLLDRWQLARGRGLRFWKLLGTGRGDTFTPADADPRRWGLLAVWNGADHLLAFERASPTAAAWAAIAEETWRADLAPLRSRGTWSGAEPFAPPRAEPWDGPVAAITRARLARGRWRTFFSAVPPVSAALRGAAGLQLTIGIGEAPVGLQGTFSVWRSAGALTAYAYRGSAHREAIRQTSVTGWYAEELFARFAVLQTTGTVDGTDPVSVSLH